MTLLLHNLRLRSMECHGLILTQLRWWSCKLCLGRGTNLQELASIWGWYSFCFFLFPLRPLAMVMGIVGVLRRHVSNHATSATPICPLGPTNLIYFLKKWFFFYLFWFKTWKEKEKEKKKQVGPSERPNFSRVGLQNARNNGLSEAQNAPCRACCKWSYRWPF